MTLSDEWLETDVEWFKRDALAEQLSQMVALAPSKDKHRVFQEEWEYEPTCHVDESEGFHGWLWVTEEEADEIAETDVAETEWGQETWVQRQLISEGFEFQGLN